MRHRVTHLSFGLLALVAACDNEPVVDLERVVRLDADLDDVQSRDIFRAFDAGPIEDAETDAFSDSDADLDLGTTDAGVDAAVDAASTVDAGDALIDAVVDATVPPPAPTTEQVVVLPKRNGMRVGWLYDGSLFRTCLPAAPGAAECGASELPGQDPRFVAVGDVQGPLLGVNTTSGTPLVFHAEPVTGEVLGWNLASALEPAPRPLRTRLFAPFNVGLFGVRTLVVGALAPGQARLGFTLIENGIATAPVADESGLPLPDQVLGTRDAALFTYPTGQCVSIEVVSANGNEVQGRLSWDCGVQGGGVVAAADSNATNLMAMTRDPATGRVALRANGFALDLGTAGQPEVGTTLRPYADVLDGDFHGLLRGRVARTTLLQTDEHTAWAVRPGGVLGARIPSLETFLGFAVSSDGAQRNLLSWDAAQLRVRLDAVDDANLERVDVPNIAPAPGCAAGRRVEVCNGLDDECDGTVDGALCCPGEQVLASATLPEAQLDEVGLMGRLDTDLAVFVRHGQIVYFATTPFSGGEPFMRVRGDWQGFDALGPAHVLGLDAAVTLATPTPPPAPPTDPPTEPPSEAPSEPGTEPPSEPGTLPPSEPPSMPATEPPTVAPVPPPDPVLLWVVGGTPSAPRATPCAPVLATTALTAPERLRVFCPEEAVDLLPGEQDGAAVALPAGAPVRWIVPGYGGDPARLLVARGPTFTLEVWNDGETVVADPGPLPALLSNLLGTERDRPIHVVGQPDARPARVGPSGRLEVLFDGGPAGWQPVSSVARVQGIDFAPRSPFAISWGEIYRTDFEARIVVAVHDLRPDGQPWGARLRKSVDSDYYTEEEVQGFALADHAGGLGLPDLYRFVGQIAVLQGVSLRCE